MNSHNNSEFALADLVGDLLNVAYDDTYMTKWLARCAEELGCSKAALLSWEARDLDSQHAFTYGTKNLLTREWCEWFDRLMMHYLPEGTCLFEDIMTDLFNLTNTGMEDELRELIKTAPLFPSNIKVALVSWKKDIVIMALEHPENSEWVLADADKIRFITKHLRNANQVLSHIYNVRWGASISSALMDSAPRGLTVLAPGGYIGYATSKAQVIINMNDGLSLEKGMLRFADKDQEDEYYKNLARLENDEEGTHFLSVERPSGKPPLQLMLAAMHTKRGHVQTVQGQPFVTLFFHNTAEHIKITVEQLQKYFSFTKAEAKVAQAMFVHNNMQASADSLSISINTVRTHLRRVYEKANISTQSELMRMLSSALRSELANDTDSKISPYLGGHKSNQGSNWRK